MQSWKCSCGKVFKLWAAVRKHCTSPQHVPTRVQTNKEG